MNKKLFSLKDTSIELNVDSYLLDDCKEIIDNTSNNNNAFTIFPIEFKYFTNDDPFEFEQDQSTDFIFDEA